MDSLIPNLILVVIVAGALWGAVMLVCQASADAWGVVIDALTSIAMVGLATAIAYRLANSSIALAIACMVAGLLLARTVYCRAQESRRRRHLG